MAGSCLRCRSTYFAASRRYKRTHFTPFDCPRRSRPVLRFGLHLPRVRCSVNTPTNRRLQFQLLFSIILSPVFAVVPVRSFLFWFRPATPAGSKRLCLRFASCPNSWRCLMSGSEGSWSSVKSGAVASLYANVFSYINTQFVRGINILRIDYTNYSLIIHPFFENRL